MAWSYEGIDQNRLIGSQAMEDTITLSGRDRKVLLHCLHHGNHIKQSRRAHVLLLLGLGWSVRRIMTALFCSADLIASVRRSYEQGGIDAVLHRPPSPRTVPYWYAALQRWVLTKTPRDFGWYRSRWSCETLALLLAREQQVHVSRETVRRTLREMEFVWRRPRPTIALKDPQHRAKMRRIRQLVRTLPPDEVAVYQDEVQIDLNPKIGSCWMPRGDQATVVTPGDNVKRHLAASLVVPTGRVLVSAPGRRRNAELFLAHLQDLCRRLRCWKRIHVICDNAGFHKSRQVQRWLAAHSQRIQVHFLPTRAPQENRIELVFWRVHECLTRNHQCHSIDELVDLVTNWCERYCFYDSVPHYAIAA